MTAAGEAAAKKERGKASGGVDERLPRWFLQPVRAGRDMRRVEDALSRHRLNTVCRSARCPNRMECFSRGTATFMVLGDVCTRRCRFCGVDKGAPGPVDPREPERLAEAAASLGLRYVVVTSVTRDDLPDGGAGHFRRTVEELRKRLPEAGIELLVPDFAGRRESLEAVLGSRPLVLNHNVETVERLYERVRPGASYARSLELLKRSAEEPEGPMVKSGLMVGLGESRRELRRTFAQLAGVGCDILTLGQYLRPRAGCLDVQRFYPPEEFEELKAEAEEAGINRVFASPLVRSSYRAEEGAVR